MVSVIIPVYNAERYVEETLRSVLASTYTDLEVVCMNDGSTDGSLQMLRRMAETDSRIRVYSQDNAGVCVARNAAIAASGGQYVLPLDADDILLPHFIADAVGVLEAEPKVKVVAPTAEFFGERTGRWNLPPFDMKTEAHKNILACTALYRRSDFDRTGGYNTEIIAREDWAFWIDMLKDGGRVVRLPEVGLRYRYAKGSKRDKDRELKRHVIQVLNKLFPEFFEQWLGGPLRQQRSWSHAFNLIVRFFCPRRVHVEPDFAALRDFCATLPVRFSYADCGHTIYRGRNELREFVTQRGTVVVKSFCTPNIINRVAYGLFRSSKAQRSCEYAALLRSKGIGSPAPVGWCTVRHGLLFTRSYYASLRSTLPFTYIDIVKGRLSPEDTRDFLREVGRTAGRMHEAGMIHRDFSRGNLLLGRDAEGRACVEIVDLNRIRFHRISAEEGLQGFSRLPANDEMVRLMAEGYAEVRHLNAEDCIRSWPECERMDSPEAGVRS